MPRGRKKTEKVTEEKIEQIADATLTPELIATIFAEIEVLKDNLEKSTRFAAAAKRARKCTTNLQRMFKEYRAASVTFWKNV